MASRRTDETFARRKERRLYSLAARQNRVVTTQQLRAIGFTYAAIVRWVAMGRLIRLHHGVYLVGRPPASRETLFHAAVLACGADAGLTGFAAAALCGFWNGQTSPIEVIAPREVRPRSGIRARQVTAMAPLTKRHGIPVTRPEATILFLAGEMYSDRHFRRLVHEALVQKVTSLSSLLAEVERAPRRTQAVERVERELADGAKPTRSGTEDELVELLRGSDFPRFDTCAHVPGTPDWMEVDVLFRAQRLVVEIDGELWHGTSYRREFDAYKDGILERAGFGVLRLGEAAVIPACQAETREGIRHRLGLA